VGDVEEMAANALLILQDENQLKQFKAQALKQAQRFDIANILPVYEAYYEKILKEFHEKLAI
jgi:hypothetical protein